MTMMRVVSLTPAATEIVCALGMGKTLVGCSHECDYPAQVKALPICTHAKIDSRMSSRAIHGQVREGRSEQMKKPSDEASKSVPERSAEVEVEVEVEARAWSAVSLYGLDVARLNELSPDVILTQAQCEVCAVSLSAVEDAMGQMIGSTPKLVSLSPRRLEDVWQTIGQVAVALDVAEKGEALVVSLCERMDAIVKRVTAIEEANQIKPENRPGVVCLEWLDPLMGVGNWIPQLIEMAGGRAMFGEVGEHSPWLSIEDLMRKDVDIMVVQPCGFDLDRTYQEMSQLTALAGWYDLHVVGQKKVFIGDGNAYFNRPGPRLVESLEVLVEILHPKAFQFGHRGTGWRLL